jgi:hypothetical protein
MYNNVVLPIEGGTNPDGSFKISPAGAVGPGQVMPGTAPGAAKLAGVDFNDYKYRHDPDYNKQLGFAVYNDAYQQFGDPIKAAAAYNSNPATVSRAIRQGVKNNQSWLDYVPLETKGYVRDATLLSGQPQLAQEMTNKYGLKPSRFGGRAGQVGIEPTGSQSGLGYTPNAVQAPTMEAEAPLPPPAAPVAMPTLPDRVRSARLAVAQNLISQNPGMNRALLGSLVDPEYQAGMEENFKSQQEQYARQAALVDTGYQADLNRRNQEDVANYQAQVGQYTDTRQANRTLRDQYWQAQNAQTTQQNTQAFEASQASIRNQEAVQAAALAAQNAEKLKNIEFGGRETLQEQKPGNVKIFNDRMAAMMAGNDISESGKRAAQILTDTTTGGLERSGMAGDVAARYDSGIAELNKISAQMMADKMAQFRGKVTNREIGFLQQQEPLNIQVPHDLAVRRANAYTQIGQRQVDYNRELINADHNRTTAQFANDWSRFISGSPLINPANGQLYSSSYVPFAEWKAHRAGQQ